MAEQIQHLCKRAYRALELSGYARIDLRLDEAGNVWVLEANPNPQIARGEDFAASAEKVGHRLRGACCSASSTSDCAGSRRASRLKRDMARELVMQADRLPYRADLARFSSEFR